MTETFDERNRGEIMECCDKTIKEHIAAFLNQELNKPEQDRVKAHIETCADCRSELALLTTMAEEAVPDPGDAFWAEMPAQIYKEAQRRKGEKRFSIRETLNALLLPRWAWAAACALIASFLWFFVRPADHQLAKSGLGENEAQIEYIMPGELPDLTELSDQEFDAAMQWTQNQFAEIGDAVGKERNEYPEHGITDYIQDLGPGQLDRLYEALETKEQDIQNRIRKRMNDIQAG